MPLYNTLFDFQFCHDVNTILLFVWRVQNMPAMVHNTSLDNFDNSLTEFIVLYSKI